MKKFKNTVLVALMVLAGGSQAFASELTVVSDKIKKIEARQKELQKKFNKLDHFNNCDSEKQKKAFEFKSKLESELKKLSEQQVFLEEKQQLLEQKKLKKLKKFEQQKRNKINEESGKIQKLANFVDKIKWHFLIVGFGVTAYVCRHAWARIAKDRWGSACGWWFGGN